MDGSSCNEISNILGPGDESTWECCTSYSSCFPGCTDLTVSGGLEWTDSAGDNCIAYWSNGWCDQYGTGFRNEGYVANDACCVCGGGNQNELYYYQIFHGSKTCSDFNSVQTTRMERHVCTQTPHLNSGDQTWTWLTTSGGVVYLSYFSDSRCLYDESNLGPQPYGNYDVGKCYSYGDDTSIMISTTPADTDSTAGECVHDHSDQWNTETCDTAWHDFGINCEDLEANYNFNCEGCNCPGDVHGCSVDHSDYGSESCDTAWQDFTITCANLESIYGWDCTGCECPGD